VRSSRRLEAETHRNVEMVWLLRHLRPDYKTIADFRRDNRKAFRPVFRQFVLLCRQLDLFGRELLAVDAPCVRAVAAWIGSGFPGALEGTHGSLRAEIQRRGGGPLAATRELAA